jgi:hypothetical protein
MMSLKFALGFVAFGWGTLLKICFVLLNVLICSLLGTHVLVFEVEVVREIKEAIPDHFYASVV